MTYSHSSHPAPARAVDKTRKANSAHSVANVLTLVGRQALPADRPV
jgi:hypothetical protein